MDLIIAISNSAERVADRVATPRQSGALSYELSDTWHWHRSCNTKGHMARTNRRSGEAVAAMHRRSAKMKHRNQPRGGARNEMQEFLDEVEEVPEDSFRYWDALED